jgi:asparaginyl-tRNA synthetase
VTNFDLDNIPKTPEGEIDFKEDFFGRPTNLTVSGQLEGELGAMALSDIYTFGPTFRAENSNTTRHVAEFWMIEPEMAFYDLNDNMDLAEAMMKYVIRYALDKNADDIEFLTQRLLDEEKQKPQNERSEMNLLEKLQFCLDNDFERLTYTEAIDILKESTPNKKKKFQYPVEGWGTDLQSEHERYLVEKHFKKPVICARTTMVKRYGQWISFSPASAKWWAARNARNGWISWSSGWMKWASRKMNCGGTWIPAATAPARMRALAWDLKGSLCL